MKTTLVRFAALAVLAVPLSFPVYAQDKDKTSSKSARKGASGNLEKKDAGFLRRMGEADLAEVETGKLAQQKASSDDVKKFAEHMVQDHGKGMKEGESLAQSKGAQMPTQPAKKHQAAMQKLEGMSGGSFDRAYMRQMVKDHEDTLKMLRNAAKEAKDPELKAAAQKKAGEVAEHLKMAKQTMAALGQSEKAASRGERSSAGASSAAKASR